MPFIKGQSGNPAGRPAGFTKEQRQFQRWCQLSITEKGFQILDKLLLSHNIEYQLKALEIMLDRGFGRPAQINVNENYDMSQDAALTDEQIKSQLQEIAAQEINAGTIGQSQGITPAPQIPPVQ